MTDFLIAPAADWVRVDGPLPSDLHRAGLVGAHRVVSASALSPPFGLSVPTPQFLLDIPLLDPSLGAVSTLTPQIGPTSVVLTQATVSLQPVIAEVSGSKLLRFDVGDRMEFTGGTMVVPRSMLITMRHQASPAGWLGNDLDEGAGVARRYVFATVGAGGMTAVSTEGDASSPLKSVMYLNGAAGTAANSDHTISPAIALDVEFTMILVWDDVFASTNKIRWLNKLFNDTSTGSGRNDYIRLAFWDTALTASEAAAVYAARADLT